MKHLSIAQLTEGIRSSGWLHGILVLALSAVWSACSETIVRTAPVESIDISIDEEPVLVQDTVALHLTLKGSDGAALHSREVNWTLVDGEESVSLDQRRPDGASFVALGAGRATIRASAEGQETTVAIDVKKRWVDIAVAWQSVCGLEFGGKLYCWGNNRYSVFGHGEDVIREEPAAVHEDVRFVGILAGESFYCGTKEDGTLLCWGDNHQGQFGIGTSGETVASPVETYSGLVDQVSAGGNHMCVLADQDVYCAGWNDLGQLGIDSQVSVESVPQKVELPAAITQVVAHWRHTCALDSQGKVWCWGRNGQEQLGYSTDEICNWSGRECSRKPELALEGRRFERLAGGGPSQIVTCGVLTDKTVFCWGGGSYGLGGTSMQTAQSLVEVRSGSVHHCGLTAKGKAYCWGLNFSGELGRSGGGSATPIAVSGDIRFDELALGGVSCGIARTGHAYCWGNGTQGQLGNGQRQSSSEPVMVRKPQ